MPGAATCSNAAMGTSLRCRKEKAGRIHRALTLMVSDLASEQHNHWLPEKTADYPKGWPFPTKRLATEDNARG